MTLRFSRLVRSTSVLIFGYSAALVGCSADDSPGGAGATGGSGTGSTTSDGGNGSGGVLGSGAQSSSGGSPASGGSSTGGGATGGSSGGDPCATAAICDHFEGSYASSWSVQKDSTPAPAIDATKGANGSTSSLKVSGTSQQSFLVADVPGQSFYVKTNIQFSKATSEIGAHGWFIVGADNATSGDGAQMRLGASGNHGHNEMDFNVYGGGCTGEKTQFSDGASDGLQGWNNTTDTSLNFDANTWYCVVAYFNGTGNEFRFWVGTEEHVGLHVTETSMCADWAPTYTKIKIGAGANGNIGDVWYDDVIISTSELTCP